MGEQGKSRRIRRAAALAAAMALSSSLAAQALDAGGLLAPILSPVTGPAASVAPLNTGANGYAAFATGTVLHAGVGGALGAKLDLVSSTAAAASAPMISPVNSELGRVALPALPAKGSYGQGLGLGLGVGLLPGVSTGLFGQAVATAPPSSAPVEQEAAPVGVAGIGRLTPLRARAQALSAAAGCVLGSSLAYGQGNAADVSLVGLTGLKGLVLGAADAAGTPLSQSESRTVIVPGSEPGRLGLMSETRQVLGPVTLLAGTPNATTLELRGEWVLRVSADGKAGAVSYGPQAASGDQMIVAVRNSAGAVVAQATADQLKMAGTVGLRLDVPGVGELVVGEQPRPRGKAGAAQASGTRAEAAVDLVRIRLLGQDVRLGHMEAAVAVPAAGVTCPGLEVSMTPGVASVAPAADFAVSVRVRNPNEGTVSDLTVASRLDADPGVAAAAAPPGAANLVAPNGAAFKLSTPLGPRQTVELPARVRVGAASGPGRVRLGASATGHYGDGPLAVPATGEVSIDGPVVAVPAQAPAAPPPSEPKISVGGKGTAKAAPTATGGRKPARTSAGATGAAGPAASAAPVTPAPTPPPVPAQPAPPVTVPAPPPAPEPAPAAPAPPPAPPTTAAEQAAPARPTVRETTDRRRWGWGAAAAIFLTAVAAAGASRLLAGGRR